jgi:hypothetical protein
MSVCPHISVRLPPKELSWKFALGLLRDIPNLATLGEKKYDRPVFHNVCSDICGATIQKIMAVSTFSKLNTLFTTTM